MNLLLHPVESAAFVARSLYGLAALMALAACSRQAAMAGGTVTNCSEASLRSALQGGGVVSFACDGTITLANPLTITTTTTFDAVGHAVTLSGGNTVRVFNMFPAPVLTLRGLTIVNGRSTNGAGIYVSGGTANLIGVTFSNNVAHGELIPGRPSVSSGQGGGIFILSGTVNLTNCVFVDNTAQGNTNGNGGVVRSSDGEGGAVFNGGVLNASQCLFSKNAAAGTQPDAVGQSGSLGRGGAIYNQGTISIVATTFTDNSASGGAGASAPQSFGPTPASSGGNGGFGGGGAIFHTTNALNLSTCTFARNSAFGGSGGAGGRWSGGMLFPSAPGNAGKGGDSAGGAVFAQAGIINATNTTFYANQARGGFGGVGGRTDTCNADGGLGGMGGNGSGGAIDLSAAVFQGIHVTAANNAAVAGSGGPNGAGLNCAGNTYLLGNGLNGLAAGGGLANSNGLVLFANSVLGQNSPENCAAAVLDGGGNVSSDASGAFTNASSLINTDPLLGPLSDHGGPTLTMALLPGSVAIDRGASEICPPTDQRGVVRPLGLACDSGAYEADQSAVVRCDEQLLQTAVNQGGAVQLNCDGIYALSNTLTISHDTTIDASEHQVTLDGRGVFRVFHVNPGISLTLIHLTIAHGRSTNGGGIYNDGGTVTLLGCVLASNVAMSVPGTAGLAGTNGLDGGSPMAGGSATAGVRASDVRGGAVFNTGVLIASNCTFVGNSAQGGKGGDGGAGGGGGTRCGMDAFGRIMCFNGQRGGDGGPGAAGGSSAGGAICNLGVATLTECELFGNNARGGAGGSGGGGGAGGVTLSPGFRAAGGIGGAGGNGGEASASAIVNLGGVELRRCSVHDNASNGGNGGDGGGGGVQFGIGGYAAGGSGGKAGHATGAVCNGGNMSLENCTFAFSQCRGGNGGSRGFTLLAVCEATPGCGGDGLGGAIANTNLATINFCTLAGNQVAGGVAGIGLGAGSCNWTNTTNGLALGANLWSGSGQIVISNSIVANGDTNGNFFGSFLDGGHNISSDNSLFLTNTGSLNNTDPKLGPLVYNGGPTTSMALEPSSPAIDAGVSAFCPATDQRGHARPLGWNCDMGAFEGSDGVLYPVITQSFTPSPVLDGQKSTLRITLHNPSSVPLTGLVFTSYLSAPLTIADPSNLASTCPGTVWLTAVSSGTRLSAAGVNLGPNDSCTLTLDVLSWAAGLWTNGVRDVLADQFVHHVSSADGTLLVIRRDTSMEALSLDGMDDWVSTTTPNYAPHVFTVSLWFKTGTTSGGTLFAFLSELGDTDLPLYMNNQGHLMFGGRCGTTQLVLTSPGSYNDGQWHHVAAVREQLVMSLIIDGKLMAATELGCFSGTYGHWIFGYGSVADWPSAPSSLYFNGEMDEIQIWNVALNQSDISKSHHRTLSGTEAGLASYWHLDEGVGIVGNDATGHGNTAVLTNGPAWLVSTAPIYDFIPISRQTNGTIKVQFLGVSGATYVLQTCTNLFDWTGIRTNAAAANGLFEYVDPNPPEVLSRFYRLVDH